MLYKGLQKVNEAVDKVYMLVAAGLFVILIVASATQVFTRYVLNASLIGTEEVARYCFIWMSLLGGSIAVGRWSHTAITVVYDLLPDVPKKLTYCIQNVLVIVLAVIFISGGITMMGVSANQTTPTLGLPKALVYLAVPTAGIGMLLHSVEHILNTLRGLLKENGKEEGAT